MARARGRTALRRRTAGSTGKKLPTVVMTPKIPCGAVNACGDDRTCGAVGVITPSQPRTGHTREPDPTHNELKHTITRKTATHERNPDTPHVHKHTHTHTPPATLPQPPPRASARTRQGNHRGGDRVNELVKRPAHISVHQQRYPSRRVSWRRCDCLLACFTHSLSSGKAPWRRLSLNSANLPWRPGEMLNCQRPLSESRPYSHAR